MSISKETFLDAIKRVKAKQDTFNEGKFVQQEEEKELIPSEDLGKLASIESGAQVNLVEKIILDGKAQTVGADKTVTLDLSAYQKKDEVTNVYKVKGSVDTFASLPETGNISGDVYNVKIAGGTDIHGTSIKAGDNVVYVTDTEHPENNGWDVLGGTTDLSNYYTSVEVDSILSAADETISSDEIDALFLNDN